MSIKDALMKTLFLSLLLFSSSAFAEYQWSAENPTYTQFQIHLAPDPRSSDDVSESANAWTSGDTYREVVFLALHELDRRQTIILVKTKYELNPFLGDTPSEEAINIYFATTSLAHFGVAYILPSKWREIFQNVTIGVTTFNATRNYYVVGVRVPI